MSDPNDLPEVLRFIPPGAAPLLDAGTAERILDGLPGEDAPPGYRAVCDLLRDARHVSGADADAGLAAALAAFDASRIRRRGTRGAVRARRVLVLTTALTLLTGAGAMAATGTLPRPIQRLADETFRAVGLPVAAAETSTHSSSSGSTAARSLAGTAALCRAYQSGSSTGITSKASAQAFAGLAAAAGGGSNVEGYCASVAEAQDAAKAAKQGSSTTSTEPKQKGASSTTPTSEKDDPSATAPGQTRAEPGGGPNPNAGGAGANGGTNPNAGSAGANGGTNPNAGGAGANGGTNPNAGSAGANGGTNPNAVSGQ